MNIDSIQILGPYNTGTNLLYKILKQNIVKTINLGGDGHTFMSKHSTSEEK